MPIHSLPEGARRAAWICLRGFQKEPGPGHKSATPEFSDHATHGTLPTSARLGAEEDAVATREMGLPGASRSHVLPSAENRATLIAELLPWPCCVVSSTHATCG